jgi:hypothetical protein
MNLPAALEVAKASQRRHPNINEEITVFDVMAKKGYCDMWDPDGKCLDYKR